MPVWLQVTITILCSMLASSGLWAFMQKKIDSKDVTREMLIGLGHDRIMCLGMEYIERGWISQEEYENLYNYLYVPYSKMNGNGSAKRVIQIVNTLPIKNYKVKEIHRNVID